MGTELHTIALQIERAVVVEDVFGILVGNRDEQTKGLHKVYRQLAAVVHPDHFKVAAEVERAKSAFLKLTTLRTQAEDKIQAGTYGDRKIAPVNKDPDPPPTTVSTKTRKYTLTKRFAQGDLCDLYECTYNEPVAVKTPATRKDAKIATAWSRLLDDDDDDDGVAGPSTIEKVAVFKIVQNAGDNDLVENESKILGKLYPAKQEDVKFYRYLPKLLDTFEFKKGKTSRRVNVIPKFDGYFSMAEVMARYPTGLDFRDVVWMFKRALAGLGFAHTQGVIHGAVLPPHILVHPTQHGARIVDWSYAVEAGKGRIRAISVPWKSYYAPEILAKKDPTAATDIFMLVKCAVALLGGDLSTGRMPDSVPKPIQGFLTSCLLVNPSRRPQDAWKLHEDLDELLQKVVGKPKYRPLAMPA